MKKSLSLLLALVLCLSLCACGGKEEAHTGATSPDNYTAGPQENPSTEDIPTQPKQLQQNADGLYELYNAQDLVQYRDIVEKEMQEAYDASGHKCSSASGAILMADIDMSAVCNAQLESWRPIGYQAVKKSYGDLASGDMKGILFDGNNHTISGLYISGGNNGALFYSLWEAEVRDLSFAETNIQVDSGYAAVLTINMKDGLLQNVSLKNTVSVHMVGNTDDYHIIGGLVASAREHNTGATIENCKNYGTVTTAASGKCDIGGIVGTTNRIVKIYRCENHGQVSSSGTEDAIVGVKIGGIVGRADGESYYDGLIIGCVNYGTIQANDGYIGGIVGHNGSTVRYCVNMGTVQESGLSYGIGVNDGSMTNCLNAGLANPIEKTEGINIGANDSSITDGSLVSRLNSNAEGAFWTQGDSHPIWSGLE